MVPVSDVPINELKLSLFRQLAEASSTLIVAANPIRDDENIKISGMTITVYMEPRDVVRMNIYVDKTMLSSVSNSMFNLKMTANQIFRLISRFVEANCCVKLTGELESTGTDEVDDVSTEKTDPVTINPAEEEVAKHVQFINVAHSANLIRSFTLQDNDPNWKPYELVFSLSRGVRIHTLARQRTAWDPDDALVINSTSGGKITYKEWFNARLMLHKLIPYAKLDMTAFPLDNWKSYAAEWWNDWVDSLANGLEPQHKKLQLFLYGMPNCGKTYFIRNIMLGKRRYRKNL